MPSRVLSYFCGALVYSLVISIASQPVSRSEEIELNLRDFLENRENVQLIEDILTAMEGLIGEHLFKFYNKINSLMQISEYLLKDEPGMPVSHGQRGDMSERCPQGFVAVPGDRNCY